MIRFFPTCLISLLFAAAIPPLYAQEQSGSAQAIAVDDRLVDSETLRSLISAGRLDDLQWPDFAEHRDDVASLYQQSEDHLVWLRDGNPTPQALRLIQILQDAGSEGLRSEDYDAFRWAERLTRLQALHPISDETRFDVALAICAMRYSSDLKIGRTHPQQFHFAIEEGPNNHHGLPEFVLQQLANGNDLAAELAALEPPFVGYRELKNALQKYEQLASQEDGQKFSVPPPPGYPGPPYAGFERLSQRLILLGDLPQTYSIAAAYEWKFDLALLQGVRNYQQRHWLPATGYLDDKTLEQLNIPLTQRAEQIRLAMERHRWLRDFRRQDAVLINIPASHLYAFDEGGKAQLSMRIDVGQDYLDTRTPVLDAQIEYLVFRPYWYVPMNIQKSEVSPVLAQTQDLSVFRYQALSEDGDVIASGPITAAQLQDIRAGRLHIRQLPHPDNPMGLLKFVLPNRSDVYLHDIPNREVHFILPQREISHGCIHLEEPAELAAWLLRDQPGWSPARIVDAMLNGPDNTRVYLSKPIPVLIFYTTVSAADGRVYFYPDLYGYDAELQKALSNAYSSRNRRAEAGDLRHDALLRPR